MSAEYDALLARIAELERVVLVPQTMTNKQEKDWDVRGGTPRIVDRHGNTLPFQQTIQFLNADVAQVNDQATGIQRTVVTPSGGGGGMAGEFSDDGTTTDAERIKFTAQSGPAVNHAVVNTSSAGTFREVDVIVAEDADVGALIAGEDGAVLQTYAADSTAHEGISSGTAIGSVFSSAVLSAQDNLLAPNVTGTAQMSSSGTAAASSRVAAVDQGGAGTMEAAAGGSVDTTGSGVAAATLTSGNTDAAGTATSRVTATQGAAGMKIDVQFDQITVGEVSGTPERFLYDANRTSNFVQAEVSGVNDAAPVMIQRGWFRADSVGTLAAGATATETVTDVWTGTLGNTIVLAGAPAFGDASLVWSYAYSAGSPDVDITWRNVGTLSQTPSLDFVAVEFS